MRTKRKNIYLKYAYKFYFFFGRKGVDVRGFLVWSLLDGFEWNAGFTEKYGLIYVDFKNGLKRHPKHSALWFKQFLE